MNSRERVFKAMNLQTPDRVPLMASPSWGFILLHNPLTDPLNVLLNGSVEEVRKSVRNCLEIGMFVRGFILNTACTISPHTPAENVDVLYEMIEKYGYYQK